jgi:hypothetical protein
MIDLELNIGKKPLTDGDYKEAYKAVDRTNKIMQGLVNGIERGLDMVAISKESMGILDQHICVAKESLLNNGNGLNSDSLNSITDDLNRITSKLGNNLVTSIEVFNSDDDIEPSVLATSNITDGLEEVKTTLWGKVKAFFKSIFRGIERFITGFWKNGAKIRKMSKGLKKEYSDITEKPKEDWVLAGFNDLFFGKDPAGVIKEASDKIEADLKLLNEMTKVKDNLGDSYTNTNTGGKVYLGNVHLNESDGKMELVRGTLDAEDIQVLDPASAKAIFDNLDSLGKHISLSKTQAGALDVIFKNIDNALGEESVSEETIENLKRMAHNVSFRIITFPMAMSDGAMQVIKYAMKSLDYYQDGNGHKDEDL